MYSTDTGKGDDPAGCERASNSGAHAQSSLRSADRMLQDLSRGAAGLMRLVAEVRVQLDSAIPELEQLQAERAMLLIENQELQQRRQELAAEIESERTSALADLAGIRDSTQAEIELLRQSKMRLETEIQELEERRITVARQIELFLKDQLNLFRQMDVEARALAQEFQTRRQSSGKAP